MKNKYLMWFCYSMVFLDYTRLVVAWCQERFVAAAINGVFVLVWLALARWYAGLDDVEVRP